MTWPQARSLDRSDFSVLEQLFVQTAAKTGRLVVHRKQVPLRVIEKGPGDSIIGSTTRGPVIVGNELVDLVCGSCQGLEPAAVAPYRSR